MKYYFLDSLTFSGYKKFGPESQTISPSKPDSKTPGSGLNVIVGGIGSGKTSLLDLIALVGNQGLDDYDRLVVNDTSPSLRVSATFSQESTSSIYYPARIDSTIEGRRLVISTVKDQSELSHDDSPYDSCIYIKANRIFEGDSYLDQADSVRWPTGKRQKSITYNLAAIIQFLTSPKPEAIANFNSLKDRLKELAHFGIEIEDLRLSEPPRDDRPIVNLEAKLRTGKWHNLEDLSDGTKELLCWLYELECGDVSRQKIVCIDEIERSLHPQIQEALLAVIVERSKYQQFFLTTHSLHIANPSMSKTIFRVDGQGRVHTINIKKADHPNFTVDHRRLFFVDKAIFVEGIKDLKYHGSKALEFGFPHLKERMFVLGVGGKENVDYFERLSAEMGVEFHAIVDDDFSDKSQRLNGGNKRLLEKIIQHLKSAGHIVADVNMNEIEKAIVSERVPVKKRHANVVPDKSFRKVSERNIYPLIYGEVENYISGRDRNGIDVASSQIEELQDMFQFINQGISANPSIQS